MATIVNAGAPSRPAADLFISLQNFLAHCRGDVLRWLRSLCRWASSWRCNPEQILDAESERMVPVAYLSRDDPRLAACWLLGRSLRPPLHIPIQPDDIRSRLGLRS